MLDTICQFLRTASCLIYLYSGVGAAGVSPTGIDTGGMSSASASSAVQSMTESALESPVAQSCRPLRIAFQRVPPLDMQTPMPSDPSTQQIVSELFEPLVVLNDQRFPVPAAAISWERNVEEGTLTFHLRENLLWSDGSPLIAEDFRLGLEIWINAMGSRPAPPWNRLKGNDSPRENTYRSIDGVIALNNNTLQLQFDGAPPDVKEFASPSAIPVPSQQIASMTSGQTFTVAPRLISNGPYQLGKQNDAGVFLERNPYYWNAEDTQINKLHYLNTWPEEALNLYLENRIDVTLVVELRQLPWVETYLSREYVQNQQATILHAVFDLREPQTPPLTVREVMNMLIDPLPSVPWTLKRSAGDPLSSPKLMDVPEWVVESDVFALESVSLDGTNASYEERVSQARQIVNDLGYGKNKPYRVRLGYFDTEDFEGLAQSLRERWLDAWIEAELIPFKARNSDLTEAFAEGRLDLALFTWPTPDSRIQERYLRLFTSGFDSGGYVDNPELNAMLDSLFDTSEVSLQSEMLRVVRSALAKEVPAIRLGWWNEGALFAEGLQEVGKAYSLGVLNSEQLRYSENKCRG